MPTFARTLRLTWPFAAGIGTLLFGLYACQPRQAEGASPPSAPAQSGGDRDPQGCIASAGYLWSPLQSRCLRAFEEGLAFAPTSGNPKATQQAFVVAYARAQGTAAAELFLPGRAQPVALQRVSKSNDDTLLQDAKAQIQVVRAVSDYKIVVTGEPLFSRPMHTSEALTRLRWP